MSFLLDDALRDSPDSAISAISSPTLPVKSTAQSGQKARFSRRLRPHLVWIMPVLFLAFWQLASFLKLIPQRILPAPQLIGEAGIELARNGQLWNAIEVSTERVFYGLTLGIILGFGLGLLVGLSAWTGAILNPVLQMFRTLPSLGLLPLFILWFGIGELPKVLLIATGCLFPLYLNTVSALHNVDRQLLEVGQVFHFSRWKKFYAIYFPAITPQILVGLRQAIALAWLSLIVAEQINADAGIGYIINNARDFLRIDIIIFGLCIYAALGLISDAFVRWLEQRARYYQR